MSGVAASRWSLVRLRRRAALPTVRGVVHAAHLVVRAVRARPRRRGGRPDRPASSATPCAALLPDGDVSPPCWSIALLATVLANVVNNLPATLLLVPLVAPLGTPAVLAALLGLNIGSGLTYTGSLANLLWRRTLVRRGGDPSAARLPPASRCVATPPACVAAVSLALGACAA